MREPENTRARVRLTGVDMMRMVGIVGVISIHVVASRPASGTATFEQWIALGSRFAVPFFFVLSGYLLGLRSETSVISRILSVLKRLAPLWVFWISVYLLWSLIRRLRHGEEPFNDLDAVRLLIEGGPAYHLWFLPSLLWSSITALILKRFLPWKGVLGVAAVSYGLFFLVRYLQVIPFDSPRIVLSAATRSLMGLSFVIVGYRLSASTRLPSLGWSVAICVVGLVGQFAEAALLASVTGTPIRSVEMTISTGLFAVGLFLVSLRLNMDLLPSPVLAAARYTLGVYAVHLLVVQALVFRTGLNDSALGAPIQIIASTLLTFVVVYGLSLIGVFRVFLK